MCSARRSGCPVAPWLPAQCRSRRSRLVGCGNFGASPNPPSLASKFLSSSWRAVSSGAALMVARSRSAVHGLQGIDQRGVLGADLFRVCGEIVGDALQHFAERRHAMARRVGEVGTGEERHLVVRCQKHRQRPAAGTPGQQRVCGLVNLVEIGPFFAIDLDIDELLVHLHGGLRVLERLVGHDMAPVAGGITDRQQDRLVFAARFFQRFRAPRVPVDRVVGVLQQVGTGLAGEVVAVFVCVHAAEFTCKALYYRRSLVGCRV